MTDARMRNVVLAAVMCAAAVVALVLASDRQDATVVWAISGPVVVLSFVGTGLYAGRRLPESRTGALMVLLGFAWGVAALAFANSRLVYSFAVVAGGLWGAVFLQLVMSFPSGRLGPGIDRVIVIAGYVIFTVASIPAMLVAGPHELGCDDCPVNVLLIARDDDLATVALGVQSALYVVLFVVVLVRLTVRWRRTRPLERLQLTPVYVCGLVTFLLVTAGTAGGGDAASWAAFIATALLPFAFLGGLLRRHVARLDAELRARLEELRASRARLVQAGDTERRRLERDLHDGAQSRLVGLALLLGQVRKRLDGDADAASLLDRAQSELKTGLAELRELARGIHPVVLTERGLEPALSALAARAPVPVRIEADGDGRLPAPVEIAAYFVVSEALANVAKYAHATEASVAVRRAGDRVAALDGTLTLDSPAGRGTRVRVEIPCASAAVAGEGRGGSASDGVFPAAHDGV